jgi:Carboxypeptidase regulatory-like domain
MKGVFVSALLLTVSFQAPRSSATVEGVVSVLGTSTPIGGVEVSLTPGRQAGLNAPIYYGAAFGTRLSAFTDAAGHFTFTNVPPGPYLPQFKRQGYYPPPSMNPPGTEIGNGAAIAVTEGTHIRGVALTLVPAARLAGVVTNDEGVPLKGVIVEALLRSYEKWGEPVLTSLGQPSLHAVQTDDRGAYEFPALEAGQYYLRGGYQSGELLTKVERENIAKAPSSESYIRTYYPGTPDALAAAPLRLVPGTSVTIDFSLKSATVYSVSGKVTNLAAADASSIDAFYLAPSGVSSDRESVLLLNSATQSDKAKGRFVIRGIPPGSYDLFPLALNREQGVITGRNSLQITDRDVNDKTVIIRPSSTLKGHITFDDTMGFVPSGTISISIFPRSNLPRLFFNTSRTSVDPSGDFALSNVPEGEYGLDLTVPTDQYVAEVSQGSSKTPVVTVSDIALPVAIKVHRGGGTITGSVVDAQQHLVNFAKVRLEPQGSNRGNLFFYKGTNAENGTFVIRGVPPGDYKIFGWESIIGFADRNADFMGKYEGLGKRISVLDGSSFTSVQLTLIPHEF